MRERGGHQFHDAAVAILTLLESTLPLTTSKGLTGRNMHVRGGGSRRRRRRRRRRRGLFRYLRR